MNIFTWLLYTVQGQFSFSLLSESSFTFVEYKIYSLVSKFNLDKGLWSCQAISTLIFGHHSLGNQCLTLVFSHYRVWFCVFLCSWRSHQSCNWDEWKDSGIQAFVCSPGPAQGGAEGSACSTAHATYCWFENATGMVWQSDLVFSICCLVEVPSCEPRRSYLVCIKVLGLTSPVFFRCKILTSWFSAGLWNLAFFERYFLIRLKDSLNNEACLLEQK